MTSVCWVGQVVRRLSRELLQPVLPSLFEGLFSVIDRSEGQVSLIDTQA